MIFHNEHVHEHEALQTITDKTFSKIIMMNQNKNTSTNPQSKPQKKINTTVVIAKKSKITEEK